MKSAKLWRSSSYEMDGICNEQLRFAESLDFLRVLSALIIKIWKDEDIPSDMGDP